MKYYHSTAILILLLAQLGCVSNFSPIDINSNNLSNHQEALSQLRNKSTLNATEKLTVAKYFMKKAHIHHLKRLLEHTRPSELTQLDQQRLYDLLSLYLKIHHDSEPKETIHAIKQYKYKYPQHKKDTESLELAILHHQKYLNEHALYLDYLLRKNKRSALEVWESIQSTNHLRTPTLNSDQPWLALANILHDTHATTTQWKQAIDNWKYKHIDHPAHLLLNQVHLIEPIERVGFILPQTGPLAYISETIQAGFLASHFKHPTLKTIKIYNSDASSTSTLYQQAKDDNIQLLIGSFEKDKVTEFQLDQSSIPIIFLQAKAEQKHKKNHYYLDISQANEIKQLVSLAVKQGYSRALILHTHEEWSQSGKQLIEKLWQAQHLSIINSIELPKEFYLYAEFMEDYLGIKEGKKRAKKVNKHLGISKKPIIIPSYSFDVIFLLTNQEQTKLINPLINYLRVENVGVFTTSMINHLPYQTSQTDPLTHIIFTDSIHYTDKNKQLADLNQTARLKKLGNDLYQISSQFNRLKYIPSLKLLLHSGRLSLQQDELINELDYFEYNNQQIEPIFVT